LIRPPQSNQREHFDLNSRRLFTGTVLPEWLDSLGHVNFLEYQRLTDQASDVFWTDIGGQLGPANRRLAYVILETHVRYMLELRLDDPIAIDTRLVGYDHRRMHLHHTLLRSEQPVCVVQYLGLAFDLETRRATHWPPPMLEKLAAWRTQAPAAELIALMDWKLRSRPPEA
jgi:acyl-CoA thioesterase FadM